MELAAPSASFTGLGISCNRDALFRNESKQENDFLPSTLFRCCFLSSLSQPRETVRMVRFLTQVTLSFDKEMRSAALLAIAAAIAAVGAAPNAATSITRAQFPAQFQFLARLHRGRVFNPRAQFNRASRSSPPSSRVRSPVSRSAAHRFRPKSHPTQFNH